MDIGVKFRAVSPTSLVEAVGRILLIVVGFNRLSFP